MSLAARLLATLAVVGATVPAVAAAAAPSDVRVAPGRVTFAVDTVGRQSDVDAGGAGTAVPLPDGGALLLGATKARSATLHVVRIDRRGAIDRSFGTAGAAAIARPADSDLLQVLRRPDGKLLLVGASRAGLSVDVPPPLAVTRLNADMTVDTTFGSGGSTTTSIGVGCGSCTTAALAPDGALVLAGVTGQYRQPPAAPDLRWALTRLTPSGAVDATFGSGGVATVPTAIPASGFNVAFGPGRTIVSEAQSQSSLVGGETSLLLTRLTPSGAPDPSFAGGAPVVVPFASGFLMRVLDDGAVVVNGQPARTPTPAAELDRQLLARYTSAGTLDAAFGSGGVLALGSASAPRQFLPAPDGGVTVVGTPSYGLFPGSSPRPGRIDVRRVAADGAITPLGDVALPFGGGGSSFVVSVKPRPVGSLLQNSFTGATLVPRPDGSSLVAGAVSVTQPTGEGSGFSLGRFAVASLTPALTLEPAFGGAAEPLRLSVRLVRQRAATARTRHGIRIELKASAVGLAKVKIKHGRRAIAHSLLPVFTTARHVIPVELTAYGNAYLRRHRNVRVSITATARDLLTATGTATGSGRLR